MSRRSFSVLLFVAVGLSGWSTTIALQLIILPLQAGLVIYVGCKHAWGWMEDCSVELGGDQFP